MNELAREVGAAVKESGLGKPSIPISDDLDHLPGPRGFFRALANFVTYFRRGVDWQKEYARAYPGISVLRFGPARGVVVPDPDLILEILRNDQRVWSAREAWMLTFESVDPSPHQLVGPLFADFEEHRDVRRLLAPAFSPSAFSHYLDVAYPMFADAVGAWIRRGDVEAKPAIRALLARIANRIFVGVDSDEESDRLDRITQDTWRAAAVFSRNRLLDPNFRTGLRGFRSLMDLLVPLMAERRAKPTQDLIGRIAGADDEIPDELRSDEARARVAFNVVAAAFDTTASGVTSMVYLLAKHPEWQDRLREEALALGARPITYDETRSLELAERVWKESLRLFPVAGSVPRRPLEDVELGGVRIPKGSLVWASISLMMHDERFFPEPERFDPDRFSPERAEDKKHRAAYLPFGGGAHTCIGMQLANAEAKAFVHALLTRARIRLARDYEGRHVYAPLGTVSGDVRIVLEPLA